MCGGVGVVVVVVGGGVGVVVVVVGGCGGWVARTCSTGSRSDSCSIRLCATESDRNTANPRSAALAGSAVARLCASVSASSEGAEASDSHAPSEPSELCSRLRLSRLAKRASDAGSVESSLCERSRSRSRGMSASASIAAALSPLKERLSTSRFGKPPTGTVREQRPLQSRWSSSSCGK